MISGDNDEDDSSDDEEALDDEDDESDFDIKERDHEITFSTFKRVSCFAHTLQLVVLQFNHATTFKFFNSITQPHSRMQLDVHIES